MPSYIELDESTSFPAASGPGRAILGITENGSVTVIGQSGSAIAGAVVTTTVDGVQALVASSSLAPGTLYRITNADSNGLYGGTEIVLQAVSTSSLNPKGVGKFYNPKYDQDVEGFGIWNSLVRLEATNISGTFQYGEMILGNGVSASYLPSYIGVVFDTDWDGGYNYLVPDSTSDNWTNITSLTGSNSGATIQVTSVSQASYASGSTTIWGGMVWSNLSGSVGNNGMGSIFELNSEDWVAVPYNETDYNVSWDEIEYDVVNDFITVRKETATGNIVEQTYEDWQNWEDYRAILVFQWGNPYQYNNSRGRWVGMGQNRMNNSMFATINFSGQYCVNNDIKNYSYFGNSYFVGDVRISENSLNDSGIYGYFFSGQSGTYRNNVLNNSYLFNNFMAGSGNFDDNILNNSGMNGNSLIYASISNNFLMHSYIGDNRMQYGCSVDDNTLYASTIGDNTNYLLNNSGITNNTLHNQSYIWDMTLNQSSQLRYNNLTAASYIEDVIISGSSTVQYNSVAGASGIYGGTVYNNGTINYNALINEGFIANNVISSGNIDKNSVTNSGIYTNNLVSGSNVIYSNTINNESQISNNMPDIAQGISNCALFNNYNLTGQTTNTNNQFYANI